MKKLLLLISLCLTIFFSQAQQISGDTIVCAGYTYSYTANYPGAVSYNWTIPNGWYDLTGQGTASISATCNVEATQICVDAYDANNILLSSECIYLYWSGVGGGNFTVEPQSAFGCIGTAFTLTIVPAAPGLGCLGLSCGNGVIHPNVDYLIYEDFTNAFRGFLSQPFYALPGGNFFHIIYCDYTNGTDWSQVRPIEGGCAAGSGNNSCLINTFAPTDPFFGQTPSVACIGDTIELIEGYTQFFTVNGWTNPVNLQLLGSHLDNPILAIATGSPAQVDYSGVDVHQCPLAGTFYPDVSCLGTSIEENEENRDLILVSNTISEFSIHSKDGSENISELYVTDLSGRSFSHRYNSSTISLSAVENGIYFINAILTNGRLKTFRVVIRN